MSETEQTTGSGHDYEEEVGFGDVQTSTFPKYQGVEGVTDRVAVVSSKLMRSYSYFLEDEKVRVRVDRDPPAYITKRLGPPEQRFALILFKYATDDEGELLSDEKLAGKVVIWCFSEKKFDEIKGRFQRHRLMNTGEEDQIDLLIGCEDSKWQKLNFDVTDGAHWRKNPEWVKVLEEKAEAAKRRADYYLGSRKTEDELKQLLGIAGSVPQGAGDDDVDLGDVLAD